MDDDDEDEIDLTEEEIEELSKLPDPLPPAVRAEENRRSRARLAAVYTGDGNED